MTNLPEKHSICTSSTRASPSWRFPSWPVAPSDAPLLSGTAYQALSAFSNTTLSSFYFDVTKDSLYADSHTSLARRHVVHVLQKVFDTYLAVLAPMAPLLAEEIHHFAQGNARDPSSAEEVATSVFELGWPEPVSLVLFADVPRSCKPTGNMTGQPPER